jgi:lipopolysaccharide transport protein LptA
MRALALAVLLAMSSVHAAELALTDDGLRVDADDGEFDLRNSETILRGNVRVSQGAMSITAEEAVGSGPNENSRWTFSRSVHVRTQEADMHSNTATAAVINGEVTQATIKGTPATFEQRAVTADKLVQGRAGQIDYDVAKGVVRLTKDVWFSYGGNEFRGDVVVYNVRDEKVIVNPVGQSNGRVNIRIRPRNGVKIEPADAPRSGNENGA